MITYIKGDIFTSECQTIVNTVNCLGVMGKGIALEYKKRYPEMFEIYKEFCKKKMLNIGLLYLYKSKKDKKWILNFPTKYDWRKPSQYEYLEKGLQKFVDTYKQKGITSIAFPLLGTQNGCLDKEEVKKIMYEYLEDCDIQIEIYEHIN